MHYQLEVDYYSNEANKDKLLVNSINEKQLKDSWRADCTGHCSCNDNVPYFVAWFAVTWKSVFQVQIMFVWAKYKSLYIYIKTK